ncbi:hypothetical protein J2Z76_000958 [Sedimentibacter acidaminivorans]|uniref:DUF5673 domain-containing protein n=1 Tax=Sedimentibacter acidaminivorans TaxID=913099 RepID=A0ABS4GBQ5_9FIRM|nr:hypothetical protein [Sedimentibacter acidaminivorans]MBP1925101.1 hypothetical protein [Sedimentibacter acidaminivorans]
MIYKVYIAIMITIVFLALFQIFKIEFNKRNRINEEIIYLNKNLYNFIFGLANFICAIASITCFIYEAQDIYRLLKIDYISNVFQLLNFEFMEELREYFFQNTMITQLNHIVNFLNNAPNLIFWFNFNLWISILFFYEGFQKNLIYKKGILVNSAIIDWNKIIDYKWSNVYKRRIFDKGEYYNLVLTLPKFYDLNHEVKLRVNYNDRDKVDDILKKYTNKENL